MKNRRVYFLSGLVIISTVVIILVLKVFQTEPDETEPFKCMNGKTVFRYKNPSKAFPIVTRDYSASFSVTTDVLKKLVDSSGTMALSVEAKN